MTVPRLNVTILRRPTLKLNVLPRYPYSLTASSPIVLTVNNGAYNIGLDTTAIVLPPQPVFYAFQSVTTASATITSVGGIVAIQRSAPTATSLMLPSLTAQGHQPLSIVDWSSSLTGDHTITVSTPDGATIMRQTTWTLFSTATQLSAATLRPCSELNGWIIAP